MVPGQTGRNQIMISCYIDKTNGHHLQRIGDTGNGLAVYRDLDALYETRITIPANSNTITPMPAVISDRVQQ